MNANLIKYTIFILFLCILAIPANAKTLGVSKGFEKDSREELIRKFGEENLRSYQSLDNSESITFEYQDKTDKKTAAITFYLENNNVVRWQTNDREEMAKQYLSEFAGGNLLFSYPKVREALLNALQKLPLDIYLTVTDRRRPILFIDYYTGGIARYAGSLEFTMRETDPPTTFENGFYIIRLGDGLNDATSSEAIEGIVLHEIMHRLLEHLKNEGQAHPCELEKEANQKLKELGFERAYAKASEEFGAKEKGDSPCTDILLELEEKKNASSDSL